jgi:uncharacterized protein YjeT (DUF2065 family)
MDFIMLRHIILSSVFSLGLIIVIFGIFIIVSPVKMKRIVKESSDVKMRLLGLLIIGFGIIFIVIIRIFNYIAHLQKLLLS